VDLVGGDGAVFAAGRMLCRPFAQDLADATGRPVCFDPDEPAHSALGAALLAARAVGLDVAAPAAGRVHVEPRADRAARWADLFDRHEHLRQRVGHIGSEASDDR
jgi:xylulokinase